MDPEPVPTLPPSPYPQPLPSSLNHTSPSSHGNLERIWNGPEEMTKSRFGVSMTNTFIQR